MTMEEKGVPDYMGESLISYYSILYVVLCFHGNYGCIID